MAVVMSVLAEAENSLAAPPWVFGVAALCVFLILAVVTWSYRDVSHRARPHKTQPGAAGHAGAPGASSHSSGH